MSSLGTFASIPRPLAVAICGAGRTRNSNNSIAGKILFFASTPSCPVDGPPMPPQFLGTLRWEDGVKVYGFGDRECRGPQCLCRGVSSPAFISRQEAQTEVGSDFRSGACKAGEVASAAGLRNQSKG